MSNRDINVSSTSKTIKDAEFIGWNKMHTIASDDRLWIWFSPDNTMAALVSDRTGLVLFTMDRATGMKIYENPNVRKEIRARAFRPKRII